MRFEAFLLFALCVAFFTGCGSGSAPLPEDAPPLHEVSGVVTYQGSPLADAIVVFAPKSGQVGASARTNADGKFVAQSFPPHDGMPAGEYLVMISKTESVEVAGGDPANKMTQTKHLIPQKYSQPQSSGLSLTVSPEGSGDVAFELQ